MKIINDIEKKFKTINEEKNEKINENEKLNTKIKQQIDDYNNIEKQKQLLTNKINNIKENNLNNKKKFSQKINDLKEETQFLEIQKRLQLNNKENNIKISLNPKEIEEIEKAKEEKALKNKKPNINIPSSFIINTKNDYENLDLNEIQKSEENYKISIINASKIKPKKMSKKFKRKLDQKENEEKKNKINKLDEDINITNNTIINLQNENKKLNKENIMKENGINQNLKNLKDSVNLIKFYNEEIMVEEQKMQDSKKSIKNWEIEIKKNKNEIKQINIQNENEQKKKEILKKIEINYKKQKEQYKNELKNIKEDIVTKVEKEYENKLKNQINNLMLEIDNKRKDIENELKTEFLNKYQNSEIQFEQKFIEMSGITKSKILEIDEKNKKSNINSVHNNIDCKKCKQNPIIGYRYKCSICLDYNLCEKCEEQNSVTLEHPHNFIKIRKSKNNDNLFLNNNNIFNDHSDNNNNFNNNNNFINNNYKNNNNNFKNNNYNNNNNNFINNNYNNNNNNFINNNIKNNSFKNNNLNDFKNMGNELDLKNKNDMYSYECLVSKLKCYILQGTSKAVLPIILKNNGKMPWIQYKTYLKFDKNNSDIKGANILLKQQEPGQQCNYDIILNDLNNYKIGEYKATYNFMINNEKYGKELNIFVIIKEKEEDNDDDNDENNKINNGNDKEAKIKEFREAYGISNLVFSDEKIIECLEKYSYDFESTFSALFK